MYDLMRIIRNDETRLSGNGFFPAPHEKDVGRKVVVIRQCVSWNGSLGYFDDDATKKTYAFYDVELQDERE